MPAGYYLDPDTIDIVEFPVERFGGMSRGVQRKAIDEETEEGKRLIYRESKRRVFRLNFRVLEDDLQIFKTLHEAVNGDVSSFYFVPDSSDIDTAYLVKKEAAFEPKELSEPTVIDGETFSVFDYDLNLIEERQSATILA